MLKGNMLQGNMFQGNMLPRQNVTICKLQGKFFRNLSKESQLDIKVLFLLNKSTKNRSLCTVSNFLFKKYNKKY